MAEKIVAIIGRPNVGKSTLFNRLIGRKKAIVHDTPGVTRDRNYGEAEWNGVKFFLIDTGGYVPDSKDTFETAIREQVKISIEEADVVLFVVDALSGITPLDEELAVILRKEIKKNEIKNLKVILVVNKVDNREAEIRKNSFFSLGLGEPFSVSALVGRSSGDLLDIVTTAIQSKNAVSTDESVIRIAVIGRPNAGKSSVVNAITQTNRNIVTDIPGTTRDSIDTKIKYYGKNILLIDTAGLRKKSKIQKAESLEFFSAIRTRKSMERCDIAVIIIDAQNILSKLKKTSKLIDAPFKLDKEDVEIISETAKLKKGILIVINKWDLIEKDSNTARIFETKVKEHLRSYNYLPFLFVSALTKQRISDIIKSAVTVFDERCRKIKTSELNSKLIRIIQHTPPKSKSHKELKINYITQIQTSPPVIGFFTNIPSEIEDNYKKFLENKIRENFGLKGVPLTLVFKRKN